MTGVHRTASARAIAYFCYPATKLLTIFNKTPKKKTYIFSKCRFLIAIIFQKYSLRKRATFKNVRSAKKGDWGFPQKIKSQKSVCG